MSHRRRNSSVTPLRDAPGAINGRQLATTDASPLHRLPAAIKGPLPRLRSSTNLPSPARPSSTMQHHHRSHLYPLPHAAVDRPPRCAPAQIKVGNGFPEVLSPFSPSPWPPPSPQGRRPRPPYAAPLPPLFWSRGRGRRRAFCPKKPRPSFYSLKSPHPFITFFPKEAFLFFLFASKPFH